MSIGFDQFIGRADTNSLKFDKRKAIFGRDDVIPLWVADTDFPVPTAITSAMQERLSHPIFGYSLIPEDLTAKVIGWYQRKHGVEIKPEWLMIAPGVMTSVAAAVKAVSEPGDSIVVQPPVYHVFYPAVTNNARKIALNPLRKVAGNYDIDFEQLQELIKSGAKALIFCSPHNPVGRVWRADELEQLLALSRHHAFTLISDDIHCDLVYPGNRHQFLFELATEDDLLVTTLAPNKTFNIPALGLSLIVVKNPDLRKKLQHQFDELLLGNVNPISIAALGAAYGGDSDQWHEELMAHLDENRQLIHRFFSENDLGISANLPDATFLAWLDCRSLGLNDAALKRFFIEDCGLGLSPGVGFGCGGEGYMRLNFGTQRAVLEDALYRIKAGVETFRAKT